MNKEIFRKWMHNCVKNNSPDLVQTVDRHLDDELKRECCEINPFCIFYLSNPTEECYRVSVIGLPEIVLSPKDENLQKEDLQLLALDNEWTESFYDIITTNFPTQRSEWFNHELNKLKLKNGPLN